jgi:hypothetical protein
LRRLACWLRCKLPPGFAPGKLAGPDRMIKLPGGSGDAFMRKKKLTRLMALSILGLCLSIGVALQGRFSGDAE